MSCPLCNVWEREPENVLWQNKVYAIVRTKDLKGHIERVMIVSKKHIKNNHEASQAIQILVRQAPRLFGYTYKAVIMDSTFGSIPDHWHLCMTDLHPDSEDYEQVLGTPWLHVVNLRKWDSGAPLLEIAKRRKRNEVL